MTVAPENTLAAFEAAVERGAQMIELDVHPTRDGQLVVLHDVSTRRTTGRGGLLADLSLGDLAELDAGASFSAAFAGQGIPSLDAVLRWARDRAYLNLDVRNYPFLDFYRTEWMAETLLGLLEETGTSGLVVIQCLDHRLAAEVRRRSPRVLIGLTQHGRPVDPVAIARAANANLLGLDAEFLTEPVMEDLHAAGLAVMATAELRMPGLPKEIALGAEVTERLVDLGVDILVTDDVDAVAPILRARARSSHGC